VSCTRDGAIYCQQSISKVQRSIDQVRRQRFTAMANPQFEREVTSERIRDKISASKRKGLWVGGMVPLGYDTNERRNTVNESEADRVGMIFRSYSLNLLMADLRKQGIVTKVRTLKTGKTVGGIPFTRRPLAHLLRNRFYIGEVLRKCPPWRPTAPSSPLFPTTRSSFASKIAQLNSQISCIRAGLHPITSVWCPMSYYRFIARDNASQAAELGGMALENDDMARDFGANVIRDLIREAPSQHAGWILEIARGNRVVAAIPFGD